MYIIVFISDSENKHTQFYQTASNFVLTNGIDAALVMHVYKQSAIIVGKSAYN